MTIEAALVSYLRNTPGVQTLVGTRIYPQRLPQTPTYPAITYARISGNRHHNIDVAYHTFQFDCWATSYGGAQDVAEVLRVALQREKRFMSGIEVIQCIYQNQTDFYEDDVKLHRASVDFRIIYREE